MPPPPSQQQEWLFLSFNQFSLWGDNLQNSKLSDLDLKGWCEQIQFTHIHLLVSMFALCPIIRMSDTAEKPRKAECFGRATDIICEHVVLEKIYCRKGRPQIYEKQRSHQTKQRVGGRRPSARIIIAPWGHEVTSWGLSEIQRVAFLWVYFKKLHIWRDAASY